ncbi:MAG: site-specific DNA-methyltransferase [Flavobacterium sp.]
MNKQDLISKIKKLDGVTQDERAYLINMVNTKKKYGLVWEDKPEDVEEQLRDNLPVLKEVKEKAIINGEDNPNHILIEGDNLHALTALTFTHEGKVDVIYIDPPYNTGNKDFKYNDTFVDKEDSYRHSKWLSFMDKRLRIAKRLLSETGVIFMSIDDNENAQLKLLCDEIFYEKNLISDVIWQSRKSVSNDTFVSLNHNYTLIYAKDISYLDKNNFRLPTSVEKFDNSDNDPRGAWVADPFDAPNLRPNLTYAIINPNNGKEFWPPKGRCWRTGEDEYLKFLADNRIVFGKKGETKPQLKRFLDFAVDKGATSISIWSDIETTTNGTQQLEDILGSKLFTNPKPLGLLDRILKLSTNNNKTANVLDFFAGSGTTLHATMSLNAEDGGNRQCILVTNNENNICEEVTYERNKRVIEGYTNTKNVAVAGLENNNFRYFKSDYVSRTKSLKNKKELTRLATELLCIKENCYAQSTSLSGTKQSQIAIFEDAKTQMVVIYDDLFIEDSIEIIKKLKENQKTDNHIKVYVFSNGQYPYTEDFEEVAHFVELCALPDAIYKAYQNVLPKTKRDIVPTLEDDETTDENLFNQSNS